MPREEVRRARVALGLRLLRLTFLYGLLCASLLGLQLAWRSGLDAGWGTRNATLAAEQPLPQALGVTVELLEATPAEQKDAISRLAAAHVEWVRVRAGWEALEPAPGAYEWDKLDRLIGAITQAGLEPMVVIDGSPPWARASRDRGEAAKPAPPANPSDFADFVGALALRYGDRVRLWQVWDEPNIAPHWGNHQIDPVGYTQLLRAAAASLRAADPDAFILTAALAPTRDRGHLAIDEVHFLHKMIAAGALGSFDAVALQPFGFGDGPSSGRQGIQRLNFQRLAAVRRALVNAGLAEVPIWAVRMGWNVRQDSAWGTVVPEDRLRYVAEARRMAAGWSWLQGLGWAIDRPAAPDADPVWGFALDDALLEAWAGPRPSGQTPAPEGIPSALLLALWSGALAATLALGARDLRRVPWNTLRLQYAALPVWLRLGLWFVAAVGYHFTVWPPLVGLMLVALALLALAEPVLALLGAAALLPFPFYHKEIALPDGLLAGGRLTLAPMVAAALALAPSVTITLVRRVAGQSFATFLKRLAWSDWLAAGWLLIALPAGAGAVWQWSAYGQALVELVLAPLLIYAAVRCHVRETRVALLVALWLMAGGLLVALVGLGRWVTGGGVAIDGVLRLVGPHYSPNHTALILLRSLTLGAGLLLAVRGMARKLLALALLPMVAALLLTASRGALLLGLPAGGATLLFLWFLRGERALVRRLRALGARRGVRLMFLVVGAMVLAAVLFGQARLLNVATVDSRMLLWQAALKVWRAHPLFGVGPGGFLWSYPAMLAPGSAVETNLQHPHSVWLEMAAGWGVVGLMWLVVLVSQWLTRSVEALSGGTLRRQGITIAVAAALVAGLAHAQVDAFVSLPDLAGWLLLSQGLAHAATRDQAL